MSRPAVSPVSLSRAVMVAAVIGAVALPLLDTARAVDDVVGARPTAPPAAVFQYGSLRFEPCTLAQPGLAVTAAARCAGLVVPEDRARPDGRRIELAVAWVPARTRDAAADPVVLLAGGPGQSALEAFPAVQAAFREVLRKRHVLLVDQRGTGRSHPMECPAAVGRHGEVVNEAATVEWARALARDCLAEVIDTADPRHYATGDYIADLESVRASLGVRQWNLIGVSYGSRVGFEYLRRHPQHIRTLTADSVVPPTLALGSEHARNLEQALEVQFGRCAADTACSGKFGSPRANLDAVLGRLRGQPATVSYRDPLTHEPREGELTATAVAGVVRLHMYSPELAAMLPMLLAEAAGGRHDTLMSQASMVEQLVGEQIALPLQLSVSCTEDAPRLVADPRDRDTLLGTTFVEALRAQCELWPRGRVADGFDAPLASKAPVLLLSGEFDPVTPPRYAESMLGTLPNARHVSVPGMGHGALQAGCVPRLFGGFVESADPSGLDVRCVERQSRVPLFEGPQGWGP